MLMDFKEIPKANSGDGDQDTFELFARDFLQQIGYVIAEDPARGADGGKDLVVISAGDEQNLRWLVSCKHFAHSGKAVGAGDEINVVERTLSKGCKGFLGFYSTLPSESLMTTLRGLTYLVSHRIFDREKIESLIIGYHKRQSLMMRYFPESYKTWRKLHYYKEPVALFNYYLKKNHKNYLPLIEGIFGAPENLIGILKNNKTLEEIFSFQNTTLLVSDRAIENIFRPKTPDEEDTPQQTMNYLAFNEIPAILRAELGIDISSSLSSNCSMLPVTLSRKLKNLDASKRNYYHLISESEMYICEFSLIYRNHIVITKKFHRRLTELFAELQNILFGDESR